MRRLPIFAIVLGLAGLLPFIACTAGILFFPGQVPLQRLVQALIAYGAVILSFLGAVHWGLALVEPAITIPGAALIHTPGADRARLALGVLPALVGWAALLVPLVASPLLGLAVLLVGFALTMLVEVQAGRRGLMPPGYLGLRWVLTSVVILCLVVVLLVRLVT